MRLTFKRGLTCLAAVAALCATMSTASAKGLDDFTLTKAIPSDAFLVVQTRGHDGQAFIKSQIAKLWEELEKQNLDRDLKRLVKALKDEGPDADPMVFEDWWQQVTDMATSVDWASLAEREYAMGLRFTFPAIDFVVLMKPAEDKVESNFGGLSGILKELVGLAGDELQLMTEGDGARITLRVSATHVPVPVGITLARFDDVILFGVGSSMADQSLSLLEGNEGETIGSTQRFKDAFKPLPAPTDSAIFFDLAKMFTQLRAMIAQGMSMAPPLPAEDDPSYAAEAKGRAVPGKLIEMLDMVEYMAAVATTDGMKTVGDSRLVLREDAKSKPLYKAFFGNGTLDKPLAYVPVSATNVSANAGIDLGALFDAIVDFVRDNIPDGEGMAEAAQQPIVVSDDVSFNPRADFIGWIGGSLVTFSTPGPTRLSPGDSLFMISVKDEAKGRKLLDFLFAQIAGLGGEQTTIEELNLENTTGFRVIKNPMLAFAGIKAPTIGIHNGWLFFGTSQEIVEQALAVGAGKDDNFAGNERFKKEGIPLAADVTVMSFKDLTRFGQDLGQALSMVGMISAMGVLPPDVARDPGVRTLMTVIPKIGKVVRKIDFLLSASSQTTFDGKELVTKVVTNYQEPPPPPAKPVPPTSTTSDEDSDSDSD